MQVGSYQFNIPERINDLLENYDDQIYGPPKQDIFRALELCPLAQVKVVIIGQDPYPTKGDACGLSFSVNRQDKLPKSLINMYKELADDLNINRTSGDLSDWAKQGVLLLNTVLTVEYTKANSHHKLGWLSVSEEILKQVAAKENIVFILLGKQAEKYYTLIGEKNIIITAPHPSPLSAYRGFFGSKIYSKTNNELKKISQEPINW